LRQKFGAKTPNERRGGRGLALKTLGTAMALGVLCTTASMLDRLAGQLERYLDLLSTRQRLVASNIANADTPGYVTRDIDFQSELRTAGGVGPRVIDAPGLETKNDGNNVSLDREARLLAENALRFQMASNLLRSQLRVMRSAIEAGK
jgi:flagellar basal-body rod protein FlgB